MKTVGIAIDDWKLPIFSRHLTAGGFPFTNAGAVFPGMLFLRVKTKSVSALKGVVVAAQAECKGAKP